MTQTIGITGSSGFIGWHLSCLFSVDKNFVLLRDSKEIFEDQNSLDQFISKCDVVIHCAGVNRAMDESDLYDSNVKIANNLANALSKSKKIKKLYFTSSTQIALDNTYSKAKQKCSEILKAVCVINNIDFHNLVIPNVFGEFCKPNYNSFVATFCDGLVHNKTPTVKEDRQLSLVHVQDLCESIYNSISNNVVVDFATSIFETSVSNVLEILKSIKSSYQENLIFPDLDDALTLRLFNTYRSYMFPSLYPMNVKLHQDHRGSLFENLKCRSGGQTFVSFTNPGMVRGNHFHFRKVERFCVIAGSATIKVRKLFEDKVYQFDVNGEQPCIVDMPTLHTHQIQNTGTNELITIFWANEIYNPLSPDTYQEDV